MRTLKSAKLQQSNIVSTAIEDYNTEADAPLKNLEAGLVCKFHMKQWLTYYNAKGASRFKVKGYHRIKTTFLTFVTNNGIHMTNKIGKIVAYEFNSSKLPHQRLPFTVFAYLQAKWRLLLEVSCDFKR